jgi:CHAT domain-containing protein/tetratricopeptide (TPR) repeat protein
MPRLALVLGCLMACPVGALEEEPALAVGSRVESRLAGGESRSWPLHLEDGQYLCAVVEQQGIDVVVSLVSPEDKPVTTVDSPNGRRGPEPLSWVATEGGAYRLVVSSPSRNAAPGAFAVRVEALRKASAADRRHADTAVQTAAASRLYFQRTSASLHAALEGAQAALDAWRELGDLAGEARALYLIGLAHKQLGDGPHALERFREALDAHRSLGDRLAQADDLNQIGLSHWTLSQEPPALEHFDQALRLFQELRDVDGEAQALSNIALVHQTAGRLREALDYGERAIALEHAVGYPDEAATLGNLGSLHLMLGDPDEALRDFEDALALLRAQPQPQFESDTLNNMGHARMTLGSTEEALHLYQQAFDTAHRVGYRRGEAASLNGLGGVHLRLGAYEQSLSYFERALEIVRQLGDRRQQAVVLTHLGRTRLRMGETQAALDPLTQASALWEAIGDQWGRAYNLMDTADAALSLDRPRALRALEQAVSLCRESGDPLGEASALDRIGEARRLEGDRAAARAALLEALRLRTEAVDRLSLRTTLVRLARVEAESGLLEDARGHVDAALDGIESLRAATVRPDLRTSLVASSREAYELAMDVLLDLHARKPDAGDDARAFEVAERFRARTLLDVLSEDGVEVRQDLSPALAERIRALQGRINALAAQGLEPPASRRSGAAERARALDASLQEWRELEARVRVESPRYAALTQPRTLGLAEIQRDVLDPETLLLEYSLGSRRSTLWAITPSGIETFGLPPRDEIEAAVRRVLRSWSSATPQPEEDAHARALSRLLLGAVSSRLGSRRIAVVADGALQSLPFAALPDPQAAARPLLARHEVVSLPSASVLGVLRRELASRPRAQRLVAVFADPVFDASDPRVRRRQAAAATTAATSLPPFLRLPATQREAQAILSLDRSGSSLAALGFDASREAVTRPDLASYRFVHFATHGWLDPRRPELSGVVLSLVDRDGAPQDGFLRLHEVPDLRLRADLVVLSACETALGKEVQGEGLVGLARGFMHAGAPRVIGSLWTVPDVATAETMQRLYRGILEDGLAPAAALRRAQLAVREEARWRRPYYWAGFVLQGEWRP